MRHDRHVLDAVPIPPGLSTYLRKQLDWLLRPLQAPFPSRRPMRRGRLHEHGCRCDRASCNNCFSPLSLASLGPLLGPGGGGGLSATSSAFSEQSGSPSPANSAELPRSIEPRRSEESSSLPATQGRVGVEAATTSTACSELPASEALSCVGGTGDGSASSKLFPAARNAVRGLGPLGGEGANCGERSAESSSSSPEASAMRTAGTFTEAPNESLQPALLLPGYTESEREFMVIGRNNANDPDDNSNDSLSFPLPRGGADYLSCLPVAPLLRDIDDYSSSPLPVEYSLSLPSMSNVMDQQYQRLNSLRGSGWVPPSPEVDDPESLPDREVAGAEGADRHFRFDDAAAKRPSAFDDVRATAAASCKVQHGRGAGNSKLGQQSTPSTVDVDGLGSGAVPSPVCAIATRKLRSGGPVTVGCLGNSRSSPSSSVEVTALVTDTLTTVKDAVSAAGVEAGAGPQTAKSRSRTAAHSQVDREEPSAKKQRRKMHQE